MTEHDARQAPAVIEAWRTAGEKLGVTVEAPYNFTFGGRVHPCLVFLPHFGTPKGILILGALPPRFDVDETVAADAARNNMGCSLINVEQYRQYDEQHFQDTLRDWGYFGPDDKRPKWLRATD